MFFALEIALTSVRSLPVKVFIVTSPPFVVVTPVVPSPIVSARPLVTFRLPPAEAVKTPMLLMLLNVTAPALMRTSLSVETAVLAAWVRSPEVVVIVTVEP